MNKTVKMASLITLSITAALVHKKAWAKFVDSGGFPVLIERFLALFNPNPKSLGYYVKRKSSHEWQRQMGDAIQVNMSQATDLMTYLKESLTAELNESDESDDIEVDSDEITGQRVMFPKT